MPLKEITVKDLTGDEQIAIEGPQYGMSDSLFEQVYKPTPKEYIKTRPGAGGRSFDYVEGGYIKKKLNEIFNGMWSFEIVREQIGKEQVWILGKLTCTLIIGVNKTTGEPITFDITKMQYGSADIKITREGNKAVDIGNDMKAAATDSLKKCASEMGIAHDVYWGDTVIENQVIAPPQHKGDITTPQIKMIHALCADMGTSPDEYVKSLGKESLADLMIGEASNLIKILLDKKNNKTDGPSGAGGGPVQSF